MCTSFVSYYADTLMGFNYDFKKSKTYIMVRSNGQDRAVLIYSAAAKQIYPQYMMNSLGLFIALQNVNGCSMKYACDNVGNVLDYSGFLRDIMFEGSAQKACDMFRDKGLCFPYEFRVEIDSLQMLLSDKDKHSYVLNFDMEQSYVTKMNGKCQVMTNFACCLEKPKKDGIFKEVYRYDYVHDWLRRKKENLAVQDCFGLLAKTRNDLFSYTLVSVVYEVKEKLLYFCINRDFDKVIKLNLKSGEIEDFTGFQKSFKKDITGHLLLLDNFNQRIEDEIDCEFCDEITLPV